MPLKSERSFQQAVQQKEGGQSLLERLRQATTGVHMNLHSHPLLEPLLSSNLSLEKYRQTLQAFYGFYKLFETQVRPYRKVFRSQWLEEDLIYLKGQVGAVQSHPLPEIKSFPALLGYWYVVEGASLGSRFIYRNIEAHLSLSAHQGARFFYAYGKETGLNWQNFKCFLCEQTLNLQQTDEAISAAVDTFVSMEQILWGYYRGFYSEQSK